jgi:hypothetical protein
MKPPFECSPWSFKEDMRLLRLETEKIYTAETLVAWQQYISKKELLIMRANMMGNSAEFQILDLFWSDFVGIQLYIS